MSFTQGSCYCDKLIVFDRYTVRILDMNNQSLLEFLYINSRMFETGYDKCIVHTCTMLHNFDK
jgi:hypothetical protein